MKYTANFGFNLMEAGDLLSAKPLNENAEKVDGVLQAHAAELAGKLMMAAGKYTGDGRRKVSVQTPGFTPKAMLLRGLSTDVWWIGGDHNGNYRITAASDTPHYPYEPGEQYEAEIQATISFVSENGKLSWSIPAIPSEYYDVTADGGPERMYNADGRDYTWIVFGTAE